MNLNKQWTKLLVKEINSKYFLELQNFVNKEYKSKIIFPKYEDIFNVFNLLSPEKIKVVILGQDPYHGINQANGLSFSVCDSCKVPPSLKNIFKELSTDIGTVKPISPNLVPWVNEGVFLMNSVLTVRKGEANSHKNKGWEKFTDSVISEISKNYINIVFILWGASSQKKEQLIDNSKHLILKAPHPSPLSAYRGFFNSKPFSKTNRYLKKNGIKEINWLLFPQQTQL